MVAGLRAGAASREDLPILVVLLVEDNDESSETFTLEWRATKGLQVSALLGFRPVALLPSR
jgi:hypothetical protein